MTTTDTMKRLVLPGQKRAKNFASRKICQSTFSSAWRQVALTSSFHWHNRSN